VAEETGKKWEHTKKAWDEVGERFTDVGRKVGEQYRKLGDEAPPMTAAERRKVDEAVQGVVNQLDRTFTSIGNAMRDAESRESLNRAVRSFGDALAATFSGVSSEIRAKLGGKSPDEKG
jgi:DNA-binding ferritin-like protein